MRPAAWLLPAVLLAGCSSIGRREQGAAIGAASGGVIGGIIGNNTGSTARGAIIGAVVGGVAGGVIGHQMDMQALELRVDVPGATVERVGEGIQVTFASGLLYDFDSAEIRAEAGRNLGNLARSLAKYPSTNILIVGHTDATGPPEFNQLLSVRRAEAAASYLGGQDISSGRIRAMGRGEAEAVASNDTDAGRQSNRRIEIAIYANAAAISNR